jgi:hypothetical protein
MTMRNIYTQETTIPNPYKGVYNVTWENSRDLLIADGWRIEPEQPPIEEGYERNNLRLVEGDGVVGSWEYTDTLISDRLTAEAEANKAAKIARMTPQLIQLAAMYRSALRSYFNENAETNPNVTKEVVAALFLAKMGGAYGGMSDADRDAKDLLEFAYNELTTCVTMTNETWSVPWEIVP